MVYETYLSVSVLSFSSIYLTCHASYCKIVFPVIALVHIHIKTYGKSFAVNVIIVHWSLKLSDERRVVWSVYPSNIRQNGLVCCSESRISLSYSDHFFPHILKRNWCVISRKQVSNSNSPSPNFRKNLRFGIQVNQFCKRFIASI